MRDVYFVSVNGLDWDDLDTGSARVARVKASQLYPQGLYGPIYIGVYDHKAQEICKLLVRSAKVNEGRILWRRCYRPNDDRARVRMRVFGRVYWLKVAHGDAVLLPSTSLKAAKQAAARSPLLQAGVLVNISSQQKGDTEPQLIARGTGVRPGLISWHRTLIDLV